MSGVTKRGRRKRVVGTVTSNKMEKTISVRVEYKKKHPQYGKFIRGSSTFKAHDEKCEAQSGDRVEIMETRPISKMKRWRLVKVLERFEAR